MSKRYLTLFLALILLNVNQAQANTEKQPEIASSADLVLVVEQHTDSISKEILGEWLTYKSIYSLSENLKAEFENTAYCPTSQIFCKLTLTEKKRSLLHLSSEKFLDVEKIRIHLEDLARKVDRDPSEAKFKVEEGKVVTFSESKPGVALDVEKSLIKIVEVLNSADFNSSQKIELPFEATKSNLNYGDANDLGISSLIGQGTSNFKGSPINRVKNIKVAIARFNGVLIKPGEEFSFVKTLGDVDKEHGYFPELVIKQGVTEPEFGGGICQVSSTAFRAAIYSGLEITARRNHAYPVSYYNPQGMDATVYVPNPDLRFKNNTPGHILIQVNIVGTVLTFDFYGTNDGRKTTVDGPYITEKKPDGALKATFTQHVFDKDGNEFINDVFNSAYASPYKYPHPGGPVLTAKPSNWSDDEWKAYKKTIKEMAKATAN
ncbi:MAG: VanW family protein [uncultured bacterium]|nr:MAG: VanW family protein [uncultured bacterium]